MHGIQGRLHKDAELLYVYTVMKTRAAVAGANGYAGMTLVNLLARHPGVELAQLTSRSFAGQRYQAVFPLLELDGTFTTEPDPTRPTWSSAACRTTSALLTPAR